MQIEQLTINFDQQQQTIKGFVVVDQIPQNWRQGKQNTKNYKNTIPQTYPIV